MFCYRAGVVFMILILSACGGLFRYCYDSNSYVVLHSCKDGYYPTKSAADEDKGLSNVCIFNVCIFWSSKYGFEFVVWNKCKS